VRRQKEERSSDPSVPSGGPRSDWTFGSGASDNAFLNRTARPPLGKLTDDDLTAIDGRREKLEGAIQDGIARDETRKQVDAWFQR